MLRGLFRLVFVVGLTFLFFSLNKEDGIDLAEKSSKISFIGDVEIDGVQADNPEEIIWENATKHSIIVEGHFDRDIINGDCIIIWPRNLRVKIYINDELKISTGQEDSFPDFIQYAGNSYQLFYIGDVYKEDFVRIELVNAYDSSRINTIKNFFHNMYISKEVAIFQSILQKDLYHPLIGLLLTLVGILVLITTYFRRLPEITHLSQITLLGWFFIVGGISYFYNSSYEYLDLFIPHPVLNTLIDLCCTPMLLLFCLYAIKEAVTNLKIKQFMRSITLLYLIIESVPIILQFAGYYDLYESQEFIVLAGGILVLISSGTMVYEIVWLNNKEMTKTLLATFPLMLCLSLKIKNILFEQLEERFYLRFGILASCLIFLYFTLRYLKMSLLLMEEKEQRNREIQNAQIGIMLSQIQPHFLYNALNTLQYICKKDGLLAAEAINHFSRYLRGNMDSITRKEPIPFEQELDHIKHYLYIEKLRFGDRIHVVYQLEYTDFYIPTLTLQPIVENAIRHGITKREQGGTIQITTKLQNNYVIIIISDDGVGYHNSNHISEDRSHIGIENVRKRLKLQCDGTLGITSTKGIGTQVTIHIKRKLD